MPDFDAIDVSAFMGSYSIASPSEHLLPALLHDHSSSTNQHFETPHQQHSPSGDAFKFRFKKNNRVMNDENDGQLNERVKIRRESLTEHPEAELLLHNHEETPMEKS